MFHQERPAKRSSNEESRPAAELFLLEEAEAAMDPRARKRQRVEKPVADSSKQGEQDLPLDDPNDKEQVELLQKVIFTEILSAKQRMTKCLQASTLPDSALEHFDEVNNRVVSHMASFVGQKNSSFSVEEGFYTKSIQKSLTDKNNLNWQKDVISLFYVKYANTVQQVQKENEDSMSNRALRFSLEKNAPGEFSYGNLFDLFLRMYAKQFGGIHKKGLRYSLRLSQFFWKFKHRHNDMSL